MPVIHSRKIIEITQARSFPLDDVIVSVSHKIIEITRLGR